MPKLIRQFLDRAAGLHRPPAAEGLPEGALDAAEAGAAMLDGPCNDYGRNVLAHALTQLQRDGWLRQEPAPAPLPRRGDHVEAWLKAQRDACFGHATTYNAVDGLLDEYRLHADTGTPLDQHACDGPYCEHDDEAVNHA